MNSLKLLLTFLIFDLLVIVSGHEVFEAVPSEVTGGQRFMREPLDQVEK
jgi:hypothetical protein